MKPHLKPRGQKGAGELRSVPHKTLCECLQFLGLELECPGNHPYTLRLSPRHDSRCDKWALLARPPLTMTSPAAGKLASRAR
jgi:hypothetical protein